MKRALLILGVFILLGSCASIPSGNGSDTTAVTAQSPADFARLGITEGMPAAWEDGIRTSGREGTYEWWYTDIDLADGNSIVIVFFSKAGFDVPGPAHPMVSFDLTHPDGSKVTRTVALDAGTVIDAAKDHCDVSVGDSYLRATSTGYELRFASADVTLDAIMTSTLPMWRPGTGYSFFGAQAADYFAWIVGQPAGTVMGTLTMNGQARQVTGTSYHDHNWGNIAMNTVLNHWYWGRARVGDYTIIACDLIAEKAYGNVRLPLFMIAKDGKILADDSRHVIITRSSTHIHPVTGKFIDDVLTYDEPTTNGSSYTVVFERKRDIVETSLLTLLPPVQQFFAHLAGLNPTYLRIQGDVTLIVKGADGTATYTNQGLWEQMFFGSNREATINDTRGN